MPLRNFLITGWEKKCFLRSYEYGMILQVAELHMVFSKTLLKYWKDLNTNTSSWVMSWLSKIHQMNTLTKNKWKNTVLHATENQVRTTTSWDIAPMVILMDITSSWMDAFSLFGTAVPPVFWHGLVFVGLGNTWKYQTRHVLKQKTVLSRSCDILLWRCLKLTSTEQVKSKPSDTFNFARIQEFQMSHMNQVITAQFSK